VRAVRRRILSTRPRLGGGARDHGLRATTAQEEALIAALVNGSPRTSVDEGPLVSVVILNRDGKEHLSRCLGALASTASRNVEIIVVDNGSLTVPSWPVPTPFPMRVIRNERRSFSKRTVRASRSRRELICSEQRRDPITRDWLGYGRDGHQQAVAVRPVDLPKHRGAPELAELP
jgi:hypothetical protein